MKLQDFRDMVQSHLWGLDADGNRPIVVHQPKIQSDGSILVEVEDCDEDGETVPGTLARFEIRINYHV
jgi:hypothetical protein